MREDQKIITSDGYVDEVLGRNKYSVVLVNDDEVLTYSADLVDGDVMMFCDDDILFRKCIIASLSARLRKIDKVEIEDGHRVQIQYLSDDPNSGRIVKKY